MPEFHSIQVFTVSRCQKVGFLQHVSQSVIFDDFVVLLRFLLQPDVKRGESSGRCDGSARESLDGPRVSLRRPLHAISVRSRSVTAGRGGEESVRAASWGNVHSIQVDSSSAEPKMAVIRADGGKWRSGGVRPELG